MKRTEIAQSYRDREDIHYNCAQSVMMSFEGELGITTEQILALGGGFGGGLNRGSVCGALSGGTMAISLLGGDKEVVGQLVDRFQKWQGMIDCAYLRQKIARGEIEKKPLCDGLVVQVVAWVEELMGLEEKA